MKSKDFEENYMAFIMKAYDEKKIPDLRIDESKCTELIKNAIKESITAVKEEVNGSSLYGLAFELSNTVDRNSYYSYTFAIHFNTEENLAKSSYPDDLDFRYGIWSEWMAVTSDSEPAKILQEYLYQNKIPSDSDIDKSIDEMSDAEKNALEWYAFQLEKIEDIQREERALIRKCVAFAVACLNEEKFFTCLSENINVYPYMGECTPKKEEILEHYELMKNEIPDDIFINYIKELSE